MSKREEAIQAIYDVAAGEIDKSTAAAAFDAAIGVLRNADRDMLDAAENTGYIGDGGWKERADVLEEFQAMIDHLGNPSNDPTILED